MEVEERREKREEGLVGGGGGGQKVLAEEGDTRDALRLRPPRGTLNCLHTDY